MQQTLEQLCASRIPGDTYRNLRIHPVFSGQTFKHILVPIWLLAYVFSGRSYQVVVNGSTGKIAGKYPYSWWKVLLLIVAILIVVVLAMTMADR
jgi:hypothetical protein